MADRLLPSQGTFRRPRHRSRGAPPCVADLWRSGGEVRLVISGRCAAAAWSERRGLTCLDVQCFGRAAGARWVRPRRARACGRDGLNGRLRRRERPGAETTPPTAVFLKPHRGIERYGQTACCPYPGCHQGRCFTPANLIRADSPAAGRQSRPQTLCLESPGPPQNGSVRTCRLW